MSCASKERYVHCRFRIVVQVFMQAVPRPNVKMALPSIGQASRASYFPYIASVLSRTLIFSYRKMFLFGGTVVHAKYLTGFQYLDFNRSSCTSDLVICRLPCGITISFFLIQISLGEMRQRSAFVRVVYSQWGHL